MAFEYGLFFYYYLALARRNILWTVCVLKVAAFVCTVPNNVQLSVKLQRRHETTSAERNLELLVRGACPPLFFFGSVSLKPTALSAPFAVSRFNGQITNNTATIVWGRRLEDDKVAVMFLNAGSAAANITCDEVCFAQIGVVPGISYSVEDLWNTSNVLPPITTAQFTASTAAEGGHMMIKLTPLP